MVRKDQRLLIDTTFWIDLVDQRSSPDHDQSIEKFEDIKDCIWITPYPIFYEVLRTKMLRNSIAMEKLNKLFNTPNLKIIDDAPYRDQAFAATLNRNNYLGRKISHVDMIIREVLLDPNLSINYLVTKNQRDFLDVCTMRRIKIF